MNYHIDIRVLQDPNFLDTILMNELFSHLHKALVDFGQEEIGVSFPEVHKTLGGHLRLHGNLASLERLMNISWMKGIDDYVSVSVIKAIPENVCYRVVKRVQSKSSSERLRRRSVKKGWLTQEEAELKIADENRKNLFLPYVRMKSQSTGQFFRLFVEHGPIVNVPVIGKFSAYGLSASATIPWFGP